MTKTKKKIRLRNQYPGRNTVIALLTFLFDAAVMYLLWKSARFANVSEGMFMKINVLAFAGMCLVNLISVFTVLFKKNYIYVISMVILCACLGISGYGVNALNKVEKSLENLTNTVIEDDLNVSLLYNTKASSAVILSEEDLGGKKIAVPAGTQLAEAVRNRMNKLNVVPEYVECTSYVEEAKMLVDGDIDCAAMPQSWQSILRDEDAVNAHLNEFSTLAEFDEKNTVVNQAGADKDLTVEPFTILLEGDSDGMSDTIIIVTVNPQSMDITMTSIARDSFVPITCLGNEYSKINSAHMHGGMGCMMSTVTQLTGIDFDYYVEVNFQGIVSIVDALGGIEITNYTEFDGQTYTDALSFHDVEMPIGKDAHINGEQALAWVRERKAFIDGDFARQRHQQEFLKIILEKILQTRDIGTLLKVLEAAGDNLTTNLSVEQMTNFLTYVMKKAGRYYDQDSLSGVFNIRNWRVTGYDDMQYFESVGFELYIYHVYDSAIYATYEAVNENLETYEVTEVPEAVQWDGEEGYSTPAVTYDYFWEN